MTEQNSPVCYCSMIGKCPQQPILVLLRRLISVVSSDMMGGSLVYWELHAGSHPCVLTHTHTHTQQQQQQQQRPAENNSIFITQQSHQKAHPIVDSHSHSYHFNQSSYPNMNTHTHTIIVHNNYRANNYTPIASSVQSPAKAPVPLRRH